MSKDALVDGVNKIRNTMIHRLLFQAMSGKIAFTPDLTELKKTALILNDETAKKTFLRDYMRSAIQSNPAEVLFNFNQLREISPPQNSVGWYNQLLADSVRNLPLQKVPQAWQMLGAVHDETTRFIAAQVIFGIRYEADLLEATGWLDSMAPSNDKTSAVINLISDLETAGDYESAAAWRKILPEKYKNL